VKGRTSGLDVCVSTVASFDDVLAAQRMLAGIVGSRVHLRGFRAGTAELVIRVSAREVPVILEALREASGARFVVAETRRGCVELWMRERVRDTEASNIPASSIARPLPLQGLTPG
jgi:hypothetical protein